MPRCGRPARRAVSRRARADENNPALSVDRKLFGTSTIGSHPARSAPAVAPHDPPRSADACRSAIGRPVLWCRSSTSASSAMISSTMTPAGSCLRSRPGGLPRSSSSTRRFVIRRDSASSSTTRFGRRPVATSLPAGLRRGGVSERSLLGGDVKDGAVRRFLRAGKRALGRLVGKRRRPGLEEPTARPL